MEIYKKFFCFVLLVLLLIMVGCNRGEKQLRKLNQIDSLMETNPQAAYDSLCRNQKEITQVGARQVEMRHRLLTAKAENKLFKPMPSDSAFQDVVDFYNLKGTSNEKMEAHYLMGCVYRDQEEAPRAMQWYLSAVECADTMGQDCDYETLTAIYGQMADIYSRQHLHQEAIISEQKYCHYAIKSNNIPCFIQGIDYIANEYHELGDTLKSINLTKKSYSLYQKHGMKRHAARVLFPLIYNSLYRAQYQQAHHYMDIYEKESGLFDKSGNIQKGYEHYYKEKGLYYLGINQVDSAEYYYRKMGRNGYSYETAQGLLSVYGEKLNIDSVTKYSKLCEQEMDKKLNSKQAEAVILARSLYNYSVLQKQVDEEKLLKERTKFISIFVCILFLYCLFCITKRYKNMYKDISSKLTKTHTDYIQTFKNLNKAKRELSMLQEKTNLQIKQKQQEISSLQTSLLAYEKKYEKLDLAGKKKMLMTSNIILSFKEMAKPKKNRIDPSKKNWEELFDVFHQFLPLKYDLINNNKLSQQEFRVSILTSLGMNNTEIAILTGSSTKTICNAKQKANKKLFNANTASTLYQNLMG